MHQGLVNLERVSQDGMRVRASAGAASFRRQKTLEECLEKAETQLEEVKKLADSQEAAEFSARRLAAMERAARERKERIEEAINQLPLARAAKKSKEKDKARVSTTDPDSRITKMANGGFRPGYNVQFATDNESRALVAADVSNVGSDKNQTLPILDQVEERTGSRPNAYLADGGFTNKAWIQELEEQGTTVYAPPQKARENESDPHLPKANETQEIANWRARMATDEAKAIYKERAATVETVNADLRTHRGMDRFNVRGLKTVRCVVLWAAVVYNIGLILSGNVG